MFHRLKHFTPIFQRIPLWFVWYSFRDFNIVLIFFFLFSGKHLLMSLFLFIYRIYFLFDFISLINSPETIGRFLAQTITTLLWIAPMNYAVTINVSVFWMRQVAHTMNLTPRIVLFSSKTFCTETARECTRVLNEIWHGGTSWSRLLFLFFIIQWFFLFIENQYD